MKRAVALVVLALGCSKKDAPPPPPPAEVVQPPRLVGLPEGPIRTGEGEKMILDLAALSADGKGNPVVAARDLPKGAEVVEKRLEWTPGYEQAGKYTVVLVACDRGACAEQPVEIEVIEDADPPQPFKRPCETLPPGHPQSCLPPGQQ